MEEAVAAGGGLTRGSAGAGRFLRVFTVGVDLGLGGGASFVRIFNGCIAGAGGPILSLIC